MSRFEKKNNNQISSNLFRIIAWILCTLFATISLAGCGSGNSPAGSSGRSGSSASGSQDPVSKQSFYFDTICQITIYGIDEDEFRKSGLSAGDASFEKAAQAVIDHAFTLCSQYEATLSKTVEGSDIWNVNHAEGKAVTVDPMTVSLVQKGIQYGDLSDGKFDITIGKAEDLWDFHSDNPRVPNSDELQDAVDHVDYKTIEVDAEQNTIRLQDPEAEIDLGGIAKGYIADGVCAQLSEDGVVSAIVSLGGNIEVVGGKTQEAGFVGRDEAEQTEREFRIGIETPYSHETRIVGSSPLRDGTMVTSGVYERYFEQNGVQYHHILNPDTGYPVDTDVLGVTIQSSEGHSVDCDALSTICLILGTSQGEQLIESMDGYEAVFIKTDDSIVKTPGIDFTPAG